MSWGGESVFVVYAMRSYPPPTPIRPAEDRYGNKGRRCSGGARGLLSRGRPARLARAKVGFSGRTHARARVTPYTGRPAYVCVRRHRRAGVHARANWHVGTAFLGPVPPSLSSQPSRALIDPILFVIAVVPSAPENRRPPCLLTSFFPGPFPAVNMYARAAAPLATWPI